MAQDVCVYGLYMTNALSSGININHQLIQKQKEEVNLIYDLYSLYPIPNHPLLVLTKVP